MNQWEALWEYQQANQSLAKLNEELKSTPNYKKYLKSKSACRRYRESLAELTSQCEAKAALVGEYSTRLGELKRQYELERSELDIMLEDEETTSEEATESKRAIDKLSSAIKKVLQELNTLVKWCETVQKTIEKTYSQLDKATAECEQAKALCEKEREDAVPEAERIKAIIRQKRAAVPKPLLDKYNSLKNSVANPVARLNGDTCGGCHMSLSSVVVHTVTTGSDSVVVCENCGRILIPQE